MDLSKSASFKVLGSKEIVMEKKHGYEKITNEKLVSENSAARVSFEAKDFYNEVHDLSLTTPLWKNESENPIYHYVPEIKQRYMSSTQTAKNLEPEIKKRNTETKASIFQTTFMKEDCPATKARLAKDDPIEDAYRVTHHHMFRELYAPMEKQDFRVNFLY